MFLKDFACCDCDGVSSRCIRPDRPTETSKSRSCRDVFGFGRFPSPPTSFPVIPKTPTDSQYDNNVKYPSKSSKSQIANG